MLFNIDPAGSKIYYVKGSVFRDKNGGWCDVAGKTGNGTGDSPVLVRQK